MASGSVHQHLRKRASYRTEHKYPSKKPGIEFLDKLVFVVAFVYPLTTIVQIYEIFVLGKGDVSVITWSAYLILTIPLLIYAIVHKDKALTIMYLLWVIVISLVVTGGIIF